MITGFRLVGVEGIEAGTAEDAQLALRQALTRTDLGIIIISQQYLSDPTVEEQVEKVRRERISPLIVGVPGSKGISEQIQITDVISKMLGMKI